MSNDWCVVIGVTLAVIWIEPRIALLPFRLCGLIWEACCNVVEWFRAEEDWLKEVYQSESDPAIEDDGCDNENSVLREITARKTSKQMFMDVVRDFMQTDVVDQSAKTQVSRIFVAFSKIEKNAQEDPRDVDAICKFYKRYLESTAKLILAYKRFVLSGIHSKRIEASVKNIEKTLTEIADMFERFTEKLYENDLLDIETDIDVMRALIAREDGNVAHEFRVESKVE